MCEGTGVTGAVRMTDAAGSAGVADVARTYRKEAVYELLRKAQSGDEQAKEELIRENTGLVRSVVLRFAGGPFETEDLQQLGYIGLLKAIMRFDTSYGVMFSTYAVPMIFGEIRRWIRDDGLVRISRQMKQNIRELARRQEEFLKEKGRFPRISELAELMELTGEEVMAILEAGEAAGAGERLEEREQTQQIPDGNFREKEERRLDLIRLKDLIRVLDEQERQIIVLRYFRDMTQQQIADRLGISQVQVSRIEKRVLRGIKREMEEYG